MHYADIMYHLYLKDSYLQSLIVLSQVPENPITLRIFYKPEKPEPEFLWIFQYPINPNPKFKPEGTRKSIIFGKIGQLT